MESHPDDAPLLSLRERLWKRWFPPVAVVGGIATLIVAATRTRPAPAVPPASAPPDTPARPAGTLLPMAQTPAAAALAWTYAPAGVVGGSASPLFQKALLDVTVGPGDVILALGDGEVRTFAADGSLQQRWPAGEKADCLAAGPDGRVYVAGAGRVDIYDATGHRVGGFAVGDPATPAALTAIRVAGTDILVADATARIIWRVDAAGRPVNRIGDRNKTKAFILPNGRLDLAVDADGVVLATDTGRHQVTSWDMDGAPVRAFGRFGMSDPADFVGCCNPVNLALTPDGKVVTGEKMIARVKVFEPDGRLLALIGPEHFDRMCTQIHLAVDSRGRILAGDPVRRSITVFARVTGGGSTLPPGDTTVPAPRPDAASTKGDSA